MKIKILTIVILLFLSNYPCYCNLIHGYKLLTSHGDTLLAEDIDASDFILTYHFQYIKEDTAMSNVLMDEQLEFLKQMNMPTNGIKEAQGVSTFDYNSLLAKYDQKLKQLQDHPFRDLYRQIGSQMIVKHLCSENNLEVIDSNIRPQTLLYFLNEAKQSNAVNLGLFYTTFLKLQYLINNIQICQEIQKILPYCETLCERNESDVNEMKLGQPNFLPGDLFIFNDLQKRLRADKEYITKLNFIKKKACK